MSRPMSPETRAKISALNKRRPAPRWHAEAIRMRAAGDKCSYIGLILGKCTSAVQYATRGLPRPSRVNLAIRARCVELEPTHSASEIAAILGVTRNVVIGHWARARGAAAREAAQQSLHRSP